MLHSQTRLRLLQAQRVLSATGATLTEPSVAFQAQQPDRMDVQPAAALLAAHGATGRRAVLHQTACRRRAGQVRYLGRLRRGQTQAEQAAQDWAAQVLHFHLRPQDLLAAVPLGRQRPRSQAAASAQQIHALCGTVMARSFSRPHSALAAQSGSVEKMVVVVVETPAQAPEPVALRLAVAA